MLAANLLPVEPLLISLGMKFCHSSTYQRKHSPSSASLLQHVAAQRTPHNTHSSLGLHHVNTFTEITNNSHYLQSCILWLFFHISFMVLFYQTLNVCQVNRPTDNGLMLTQIFFAQWRNYDVNVNVPFSDENSSNKWDIINRIRRISSRSTVN